MITQNDIQRLGVLQALFKAIGKEVSTKDPDSLRSRVDAALKELNASTGVKSLEIVINGLKFGQLTAKTSDRKTVENVYVNDVEDLVGEALPQDILDFIRDNSGEFACWLWERHKDEGEIPPGCEVVVHELPAQFIGTTLTGCKPEDLGIALGDELPSVVIGALEGGGSE